MRLCAPLLGGCNRTHQSADLGDKMMPFTDEVKWAVFRAMLENFGQCFMVTADQMFFKPSHGHLFIWINKKENDNYTMTWGLRDTALRFMIKPTAPTQQYYNVVESPEEEFGMVLTVLGYIISTKIKNDVH